MKFKDIFVDKNNDLHVPWFGVFMLLFVIGGVVVLFWSTEYVHDRNKMQGIKFCTEYPEHISCPYSTYQKQQRERQHELEVLQLYAQILDERGDILEAQQGQGDGKTVIQNNVNVITPEEKRLYEESLRIMQKYNIKHGSESNNDKD